MSEQSDLTIEIIGSGTVGSATGRALADWGHRVVFKDIDDRVLRELSESGYRTAHPTESIDAELSIISVPTPYDADSGQMKTDIVERALETLMKQDPQVVAIRSTVPPTTTETLADKFGLTHYAMVPEFLFEDSAYEDLKQLESLVVGANTQKAKDTVKRAFGAKVSAYLEVAPTEAEFIKFGSNVLGATKISFANEMWRLASQSHQTEPYEIDPNNVLMGIRHISPWFGPNMGMQGGWPYGGHCLPKDTKGLQSWAEKDQMVAVPQLTGTIAENDLIESYSTSNRTIPVPPQTTDD